MGLSRRFLNLTVHRHDSSMKSLHCIDLKRLDLFYPTTPPPPTRRPATMQTFGLPSPNTNFQACSTTDALHQRNTGYQGVCRVVACYPLARRKVLCTDQCGRNFLYDASTHEVATVPEFHRPRFDSLSLFVPSGGGNEEAAGEDEDGDGEEGSRGRENEEDRCGGEGSLYMMESVPKPVTSRRDIGHPTDDLEVLFYGNNGRIASHCKLLPPPPYVHEPSYRNSPRASRIGSYAVVGNGSHVCVSAYGRGTYFLDTARHTWDKVGDWTLPFRGKAEYVPELKLWFGLSADAHNHLAAADLSTTDYYHQPQQLLEGWKEFQPLEEEFHFQPLDEWFEHKDAQLVNLGSGRFCIARFFWTSHWK